MAAMDFDATKFFADMKMPMMNFEGLMTVHRKNMEAMTTANQMMMEAAQAVMKRQQEILRQHVEDSSKAFQDMMAPGTPEEKMTRQTDMMKAALQRAVMNARELGAMVSKTQADTAEVLTSRFAESLDDMKNTVKTAPTASTVANEAAARVKTAA